MKKVAIGMAVMALCAGMAMAAGTCNKHEITYYGPSCYKCDAETAERSQRKQAQCEEWKTQSTQKPSGNSKQKTEQQEKINKAKQNFDDFCIN